MHCYVASFIDIDAFKAIFVKKNNGTVGTSHIGTFYTGTIHK